ncbi:hypothetical protein PPERSA_02123 [Pseudocohnilembus persalinus]|uniref:Uncharacterized protein n=1 Tax=Pseudocohnilembus persalinus TaxID=266149 RepID=A0A0V0Q854_PSEPJ|nr:hypothetical protein PPERSA_02123 [Pseudocohnilembus persalinus]|eukprot:KRW98346.1 hypothetical protein PPERSA_02123 [Pseudocohnilembus persalinus]
MSGTQNFVDPKIQSIKKKGSLIRMSQEVLLENSYEKKQRNNQNNNSKIQSYQNISRISIDSDTVQTKQNQKKGDSAINQKHKETFSSLMDEIDETMSSLESKMKDAQMRKTYEQQQGFQKSVETMISELNMTQDKIIRSYIK